MIPRALVFVAALLALVVANAADASPSYSVKRHGLWYWSTNIANNVFPTPTFTVAPHASASSLVQGLGLSADEKRYLEGALAAGGLPGRPYYSPTPGFHDGTVVLGLTCRGLAPSIASPEVNVDLFHKFRCRMAGTRYTRLASFKAAIPKVRAAVAAAADPKPPKLLNAFLQAYANLAHYQAVGDRFQRSVTLTVTGRRSDSITN